MGDSAYKGVSAAQDSRFTNKESALLRKLKFPAHFDTKVDMTKVELSVIKPWIARRITELLGFEDDVVLEYAAGMLEDRFPDAKKVQIQLMGFLEDKTAEFMTELWELLISAQNSPGGVPQKFVEEKKEELRRKREEGERVVREARERAQRAAESAPAAMSEDGRSKRRSRWDAGAPSSSNGAVQDTRPPAYRSRDEYRPRDGPSRNEWGDRRRRDYDSYNRNNDGSGPGRSRDAGWGSRAPREAIDSSHYTSRRSPSPPPRHRRRSSTPPPREHRTRQRSRSRSRSVTPDYRATLRDRKKSRPVDGDTRDRLVEDRSYRARHSRNDDAEDDAGTSRRRSRHEPEKETERERELRDKLSRARASKS
ncbi:hypothetical protein EX895_004001 [Sporisorium graminicola]|uniref:PWI domain-containing protein n=1 Tax=Sporisorium graminicola TaxID=280036 RepID=A0A4U7KS57_9BASI|nr:hypothetical protein EX895_004001 [Sporisorium graminicola]TKY87324.1 hypothetical protein EX895_004001 [Sporisorium graminicola]